MQPSILLYDGIVVTMRGKGEIYNPGYVYVEDGRIRSIGWSREMSDEHKRAELVYRIKGKIVMPGLVDMHTHLALYPIRMLTPNLNLDRWVEEYAWNYERRLSGELSYYSAKLALYALLKRGVVGVFDMHFNMEHVARAIEEVGVYGNLSVAIMNRGVYDSFEEALGDNVRLAERYQSSKKITVYLGPCTVRLLEMGELEEVAAVARERRLGIHMHLSEVEEDVKHVREKYDLLPAQLLEKVGLLGSRTLLAHCVFCSQKELHLIRRRGASIALCPTTNLHMASGVPPIPDVDMMQINAGFGTDVSPYQDPAEEASLAHYLSKTLGYTIDPYRLLEMLTINGGKILREDPPVTPLRPGAPATIIVLDSNSPTGWSPIPERIYEQVVFGKLNVETVIVDGEVIVDGGEPLTVGQEEIVKAKGKLEEIMEDLGLANPTT